VHNILKTIEHSLGVFFILGIFGIAALGVWSLSPISKPTDKVAGIQTSEVTEISGQQNIKLGYSSSDLNNLFSQFAILENGSHILKIKAQNLRKGETVVGALNIENSNLFASKLQITLATIDQKLFDKVSIVIDYDKVYQLNRFSQTKFLTVIVDLAAQASNTATVKIVSLEDINFNTQFEIYIK